MFCRRPEHPAYRLTCTQSQENPPQHNHLRKRTDPTQVSRRGPIHLGPVGTCANSLVQATQLAQRCLQTSRFIWTRSQELGWQEQSMTLPILSATLFLALKGLGRMWPRLRCWWPLSRRLLSIYPWGHVARTTDLASGPEEKETKNAIQELKMGANVHLLTCPFALVHFSSAPLNMLWDGGTAHLWNNISTVVTDAKTAPSLSLGYSHQSAT